VNRLDRQTSGVVLLAKSRKAYMLLSREHEEMGKVYLARVRGDFQAKEAAQTAATLGLPSSAPDRPWVELRKVPGEVTAVAPSQGHADEEVICRLPLKVDKHQPDQPLTVLVDAKDGKSAETSLRRIWSFDDGTSLVRCRLATGRTHQIRVHLSSLGYPIVGDPVYGGSTSAAEEAETEEMCLHAAVYSLRADSSENGKALKSVLPPPLPRGGTGAVSALALAVATAVAPEAANARTDDGTVYPPECGEGAGSLVLLEVGGKVLGAGGDLGIWSLKSLGSLEPLGGKAAGLGVLDFAALV
ncbi:unnamed protein product, partial [Polarella glacialis]